MTAMEAVALPIGVGLIILGAVRLHRYRSRPCKARFEANEATTFTCARVNHHKGAHSDPNQKSYSFEWYDGEQRGKDPAPAP